MFEAYRSLQYNRCMLALNFHHLRYFWTIATEGSLAAAARRLNVSASALSVQLKALEDQFGHPLFERRGRALTLTEAGRIALDHASTIMRAGDELVATLRGLGSLSRRPLRIGAVATLSRNFQIGLLRPLLRRPGIELTLRSGTFAELTGALAAHSLDLVLANQRLPEEGDGEWQTALLADQPVSLVSRPAGRARAFRFPDDLRRLPLVVPSRASVIRSGFDRLLETAGVSPRILAEVDDMAMLRLMARDSPGVTLVPSIVVVDELASGTLVERCQVPGVREPFYAITRRRRFPHPLLRALLPEPQPRNSAA
jgi:LysR family transcriptional activator of nhaA